MLAFDTSKKAIGKRMRQLRKGYGLKQEDMAEALGITGGALSSIETGRNHPSTLTAMVAWQKYGAPLEWLLAGVETTLSDKLRERLAHGPPSSSEGEPSS